MLKSNKRQVVVFYIAFVVTLFVLFVHNPTQGYTNTDVSVLASTLDNPISEKRCYSTVQPYQIYCLHSVPFTKWESRGALMDWFRTPLNVLWAFTFILALIATLFFMLRTQDKGDN